MHVAAFLLFCLSSICAFEALVNHDRWWHYSPHQNGIQKSYQYFYPNSNRQHQHQLKKNTINQWKSPSYHHQRKKDGLRWKYPSTNDFFKGKMPTVKMPKFPTMTTNKYNAQATREWPDYIPPFRMISPSLDEPPAF